MNLHELNGHRVQFTPVDVAGAFDHEERAVNLRHSLGLRLPNIFNHPMAGHHKNKPLAILAGGPSLDRTFSRVAWRHYETMTCGSVHDHLRRWYWHPTYAVCLDADPGMARFFRRAHKGTDFLLASTCDRQVFSALRHRNCYLWHSAGDVDESMIPGEGMIGGGSTVALRANGLALVLGYSDLHFFGLDSCLVDGREHGYDHATQRPAAFNVEVNGRRFLTTLPLIAQAQEFMAMWQQHRDIYNVTVHGDGMIADMVRHERG